MENNQIIDLNEKIRKYKNDNSEDRRSKYKKIQKYCQQSSREAKEEWLNNVCLDIDFMSSERLKR